MTIPDALKTLPRDGARATLLGRAWLPAVAGPTPVVVRDGLLFDVAEAAPTVSQLLEMADPLDAVRSTRGVLVGSLEAALAARGDPSRPHLLAPCDLQPVKAAGVTFATSLLERVIEEHVRGNPDRVAAVRTALAKVMDNLGAVRPGSAKATALKAVLTEQGMWSQYLEVGIGPDAEIFTKAAPMSSVGTGEAIGLHPESTWNNPEPEIVLAVDSHGRVRGATLGNDVNLRDFEGRSALLLGRAKDNNGSCAIGPFIRLFDEHFSIGDVRNETVTLEVRGEEGYVLNGSSSMAFISRDPLELVRQAMGTTHQYPDGLMLFLGTMFAPVEDRGTPGSGFTHKVGDEVQIASPRLGALINRVDFSDRIPPWKFGLSSLMESLAHRGLLAYRAAAHAAQP